MNKHYRNFFTGCLLVVGGAHAEDALQQTAPSDAGIPVVMKRLFGADDAEASLKKRIANAPDAELVFIFEEVLGGRPSDASAITRLFIERNSSLSGSYLASILKLRPRPQIKVPANVQAEIQKQINAAPTSERPIVAAGLMKRYPEHALAVLIYAHDEAAVDGQDLIDHTSAAFAESFAGGVPKLALLGLLALGGGGGGGGGSALCGGGSCTEITPPGNFVTPEYSAQEGLAIVNAKNLYAYGGTGAGIKVAVLDTGILASHGDFSGRILSGYDYNTGSSTVSTDGYGHGTHVSGIIAAAKNDAGMHGVAYEASIVPIKVFNDSGTFVISTDALKEDAFSRATASGARIFNNSWGTSVPITSVTRSSLELAYPLTLAQMQSSVNSDAVFVWANGNDYGTESQLYAGLPYRFPDLESGWLAVMAVDLNGNEASYSNRCGVSAAWCIAAPGGGSSSSTQGVYSTYNNGSYTRLSGTSMAAPHVSGALAALKSRFPNLSYHQVRDRLLVTANRTGIYASSAIYGQGLMDLNAAASPVGVTMLTLTDYANGEATGTSGSQLSLPSGLYDIFRAQLEARPVMVVDSFQRAPFFVDASVFVRPEKMGFDMDFENLFSAMQKKTTGAFTGHYDSANKPVSLIGASETESGKSRWFIGKTPDGRMQQGLRMDRTLFVGGGGKYAGFSHQFGGDKTGLHAGMWMGLPSDSKAKSDRLPMFASQGATMASARSGMWLSRGFVLGKDFWGTAALAYGKPETVASGVSASGAFAIEARDVSAASLGLEYEKSSAWGQFGISGAARVYRQNAVGSVSLVNVPEGVDMADFDFELKHVSHDKKTSTSLSIGRTKVLGGPQFELSLPTSVDEDGKVDFLRLTAPLSALYNQNRLGLSVKHRQGKSIDLLGVLAAYSTDTGSPLDDYVIGVAASWPF